MPVTSKAQSKQDIENEIMRLKKTIVYLNDFALQNCRQTRDSMMVLAYIQMSLAEFYSYKADSLNAKLQESYKTVKQLSLELDLMKQKNFTIIATSAGLCLLLFILLLL